MFIKLAQLVSEAALDRLTITIQPGAGGRLQVIVNPTKGAGEVKDEKLRQALAGALHLEGSAIDIDSEFMNHLAQYSERYTELALVSNTEQLEKSAAAALSGDNAKTSAPKKADQNNEVATASGTTTETSSDKTDSDKPQQDLAGWE